MVGAVGGLVLAIVVFYLFRAFIHAVDKDWIVEAYNR